MTFDPTKPVQTRCGYPARILATDLLGEYPIVAAIIRGGGEVLIRCDLNGMTRDDPHHEALDLINIPQKHVRWVNVYRGGEEFSIGDTHKSKDEADKSGANQSRIACIRIEFQEGEGL